LASRPIEGGSEWATERTHLWYTGIVKVTSAEFRKNLFQIVERALQCEPVEVLHEGRVVRLVPGDKPSKMSRLIQRDTIHGTLEDLDRGQRRLDDEMRVSWDGKWNTKL
jgi:antitoxin (DNA-binding transcriptional repressor) of toxin-antitoxin stability system